MILNKFIYNDNNEIAYKSYLEYINQVFLYRYRPAYLTYQDTGLHNITQDIYESTGRFYTCTLTQTITNVPVFNFRYIR